MSIRSPAAIITPLRPESPIRSIAPIRARARFVRCTPGLVNRAMTLCDWCSTFVGVALCVRMALKAPLPSAQAVVIAVVAATAAIAALRLVDAYRTERYRNPGRWLSDVAAGWIVAMVVGALVLSAFAPAALSEREPLALWALCTLALMGAARAAAAAAYGGLSHNGSIRRRVAVITHRGPLDPIVQDIVDGASGANYELLGVFEDEPIPCPRAFAPNTRSLGDLCRLAQTRHIDVIVIASPRRRAAALCALVEQLQWISADLVIPFELPAHLSKAPLVTEVAGIPMLVLIHHPLKGTEGVVKLAEDYIVASLALIAAAPIMLLAALAVRMTSPGPALFRQPRVGFNGRLFEIYKFRSMRVDPGDDGSNQAVRDDDRLTRVGAFLRRTSIDELPQLFNVLRGDMSVVGPRPHVPNTKIGDAHYRDVVRSYAARHRIKPGITGWAQINGARGGIHTTEKAEAAVEADLHYIKSWSLMFDLQIILRTFSHLMARTDVV